MRALFFAAALSLVCGTMAAQAQSYDSKGRCRAPDGKLVKASQCAKVERPQMKCREVISHRPAKCGAPNAEPMPVN